MPQSNAAQYNPALGYPTVNIAPSGLGTATGSTLVPYNNWYNSAVGALSKEPESLIPKKETFVFGVHRAKKFCTIEDNSYWVVVSDTFLLRCLGKEGVEEYVNSTHTYGKSEIEPLLGEQGITMIPCSEFIELVATRGYQS